LGAAGFVWASAGAATIKEAAVRSASRRGRRADHRSKDIRIIPLRLDGTTAAAGEEIE
jgi:hypothetical protein